jgi:hypothetical protein
MKRISIPVPEGKNSTKNRIAMIASAAFSRLSSKNKELTGSITVYELLQALKEPSREPPSDPKDDEIRRPVPKEYHDFVPLFKKAPADKLLPHRKYDHTINLKPGFEPPVGPSIGMCHRSLTTRLENFRSSRLS